MLFQGFEIEIMALRIRFNKKKLWLINAKHLENGQPEATIFTTLHLVSPGLSVVCCSRHKMKDLIRQLDVLSSELLCRKQ